MTRQIDVNIESTRGSNRKAADRLRCCCGSREVSLVNKCGTKLVRVKIEHVRKKLIARNPEDI